MKGRQGPASGLLGALAAAVLAAHLALLGSWEQALRTEAPVRARAFITRSISAGSATTEQVVPAAAAGPVAAAAPARRRAMVPVRREPAAAPVPPAAQVPTVAEPELVAQASAAPAVAHDPPARPRAFSVPASVRLRYQVEASVRGLALRADGELLWRHDGTDYEAKLEIRGTFVPTRTQRSTGQITASGVTPLRFSDRARSEEAAHFERDKGVVSFSSNRPQAALLPGAQDRLSVMIQLGSMIAGEPARYPAGTAISIQTASTRDAETWVFTVEGPEQLNLPGGTLAGLKLVRNPRREFDQKVELWLAPAMDYVPVRIRLTNPNGDTVDQLWGSTDKS